VYSFLDHRKKDNFIAIIPPGLDLSCSRVPVYLINIVAINQDRGSLALCSYEMSEEDAVAAETGS